MLTSRPDGTPVGRTLILKDIDDAGYHFSTHRSSRKGIEIAALTSHPSFPGHPTSTASLSRFELPGGRGDGYGARVRAILKPPQTGTYRFKYALVMELIGGAAFFLFMIGYFVAEWRRRRRARRPERPGMPVPREALR